MQCSGYLAGTLGSAMLIELSCLKDSKMVLASLGIFLSGIALALMPHAVNVAAMYVLIVLQGLGFGSIDSLCNIVLPEVWGDRVQVRERERERERESQHRRVMMCCISSMMYVCM